MTTLTPDAPDAARTVPTFKLPYGEMPWRTVTGNPTVPLETDIDGHPLTLAVDTPASPDAVTACGGELAWWRVCQAIRMPGSWQPPEAITITRIGSNAWLVTAPSGEFVVRRTVQTGDACPRLRHRARDLVRRLWDMPGR